MNLPAVVMPPAAAVLPRAMTAAGAAGVKSNEVAASPTAVHSPTNLNKP